MGCCGGDREKQISAAQKWDYINLSDFRSTSCFTPLSYGFLLIMLVVSIACYAVDVFTAYNLIFFDKWTGQVQPVHIDITRWIFAGCIILSWILLIFRYMTALRAIKSGGIAKSYLDPLAVRIQSLRMGKNGRGWRRFLVFAELTKSKKGSEYVALFTYFSFEAWLRIIFAEGPRNVINAMTLYAVMQAQLIPKGSTTVNSGHTPIVQFFINVGILAESNHLQAAIMFGMLFTLIIWVISVLSLAIAVILYIMFLWHHIPSQDGGLRGFLKRKIDKALQKIVDAKIKKAFAKETMAKSKEDLKATKNGEPLQDLKRQPTLPVLGDDKLPEMPMLTRQNTQATLPPYATQPPTRTGSPMSGIQRQPTLPDMDQRPSMPNRTNTMASSTSYASNAPLISSASPMGYGPPESDYPPLPLSRMGSQATMSDNRSVMNRSVVGSIQGPERSFTPAGVPPRSYTPGGSQRPYTPNGGPPHGPGRPMGPPLRQNTGMSVASTGSRPGGPGGSITVNTAMNGYPPTRSTTPGGPQRSNTPGNGEYQAYRAPSASSPAGAHGRNSPAPSGRQTPVQEFEMRTQTPQSAVPRLDGPSRFQAYNPNINASPASASPVNSPTVRNFTAPLRLPQNDQFAWQQQHPPPQRSGTAPVPQSAMYDQSSNYDDYDEVSPTIPGRAATASPRQHGGGYQYSQGHGPAAY